MTERLKLSVRHVLTILVSTNLALLLLLLPPPVAPPLLLRLLIQQQPCDGQQDVPAVCCRGSQQHPLHIAVFTDCCSDDEVKQT
jgi:hypothetical protein